MCFRGCRGEGDERGKAEQTRGGAERGYCCDDLKRKQRVALASAEREKEKTSGREWKRGRKERGRMREPRRRERAVDVGTSVSRCEGRNRSLSGSQGVSRVE